MDDLDAILADLQLSTVNPDPPPVKSPVYAEPFRPPHSTQLAQQPLGETLRQQGPDRASPRDLPPVTSNVEPDTVSQSTDDVSDDYAQELQRLQEPSRSSNIEDLDSLLEDLNFVQKSYSSDRRDDDVRASRAPEDDYPAPDLPPSSATKDLDSLMESLDFNMPDDRSSFHSKSGGVQGYSYDNLDGMMASLDTDLAKKGVQVNKRGVCAACDKMIVGRMVTALGKTWHPQHFVCIRCKVELGTGKFFERDEHPYCERDYHLEFAPRCAYCDEPIIDKCITALQKTWHPEHFVCVHCKVPFTLTGTEYHVYEGKPYCKVDYHEMFAPKCSGCSKTIANNVITALKRQWHVECFVCYECKNRFGAGTYYEHDGKPYCELHYHQHRGSLCAACNKPISGRVITAMRNKFHPEHFVCAFCITPLSKGTFKEHESKPYCHTCYQKLFGIGSRA